MKSPNFLTDQISNHSESSSQQHSTNSLKIGFAEKVFTYKKKPSTLTKENLDEFTSIEDKKYDSSPYYKGLLKTDKVPGTSPEAEGTTPTAHDFKNLSLSSPYYKGLLKTDKVPGTSPEAEGTTPISHDYKGLLYTEKYPSTGMGTTSEAECTTVDFNSSSPYYKGLMYQEPVTSRERKSHAVKSVSSSSSMKMQGWTTACFPFKWKDEKAPTMIKVYSTEHSIKESLRERVSETSMPPQSPTPKPPLLPPPKPPSPTKTVAVNAEDSSCN